MGRYHKPYLIIDGRVALVAICHVQLDINRVDVVLRDAQLCAQDSQWVPVDACQDASTEVAHRTQSSTLARNIFLLQAPFWMWFELCQMLLTVRHYLSGTEIKSVEGDDIF
jgi:hypothetical protein